LARANFLSFFRSGGSPDSAMRPAARHILLVDDNVFLLRSMALAITEQGHFVGTAQAGREAISYIRVTPPDVVVLDIFMPEMDGFETLHAIRAEFPQLRTVLVSGGGASHNHHYLQMISRLGADAVLQKPFTARRLLAVALP
jgi:CheY-like chemotaxis protein